MRRKRKTRDFYLLERQGLVEGIRLANPDVVHAHWTYEFALACLHTGLPTLVTSHDNAFRVFRFAKNLYTLVRLYLQIQVIRKARFLTAVSPYLADAHSSLTKKHIAVIPNPVEIHSEETKGYDEALTPGAVKIATVLNGWTSWKNPKAAIKAFNLVLQKKPEAELFMYGLDFDQGGVASKWAKTGGFERNIHFCGYLPREQLQRALNGMSVLFGMAVAEAMTAGIPVVGGEKSGAVPWLLNYGQAGYLTDVRDPAIMAQTLVTCIEDVKQCERKRQNARDRITNLFSPKAVAEQYETMFDNVLTSS
jgi:L-malate glycosyltransferase